MVISPFQAVWQKTVGRQNCGLPRQRVAAFFVLHARAPCANWNDRRHVDLCFAATVVAWASAFWGDHALQIE
jgi:hypothetical protein